MKAAISESESDAKVNIYNKFQKVDRAREAIARGIQRGDCVVEMEAIDLPQRTINALEFSEHKIVTLEQLMNCKPFDLMCIPNIGATAINKLIDCLSRYDELEQMIDNEPAI